MAAPSLPLTAATPATAPPPALVESTEKAHVPDLQRFMPNVFMKGGEILVFPHPRPPTDEAIRATEAEYRRRLRRSVLGCTPPR